LDSIEVIDLASGKKIPLVVTINDALKSIARLTRRRPTAYFILPGNEAVIEKLETLGLATSSLQKAETFSVESYTVSQYGKGQRWEGVAIQQVKTEVNTIERIFPEGTRILKMDQPKANLAPELLEPEAGNGFVRFDVIRTGQGQELPVYRYYGTN